MANQAAGKASSEIPALKPYWGKPAVRNFRGGNGNVGIIRSPVRAIALPDNRSTMAELWALNGPESRERRVIALSKNVVLQLMPVDVVIGTG